MITGEFGLEPNGLTERVGRRAVIPLEVAENVAQRVVGVGEVGLDADGDAMLGDRVVELPLHTQRLAEIVVEGGVVGLEVDGGAVLRDRLIELPLDIQREAQAEMGIGVVGPLADGLAIGRRGRLQHLLCFPQAALALQRSAQAAEVAASAGP